MSKRAYYKSICPIPDIARFATPTADAAMEQLNRGAGTGPVR